MKQHLLLATIIAVLTTVSCSHEVKYSVEGIAPKDGATVSIVDMMPPSNSTIISTEVKDGKFSLSGKADKNAFLAIQCSGSDWVFHFFNDGKPITIDFTTKSFIGSELNNRVSEYKQKTFTATQKVDELNNTSKGLSQKEIEANRSKLATAVQEIDSSFSAVFSENRDNIIPVAFLPSVNYYLGSNKVLELFDKGGAWTRHPYAQSIHEELLYNLIEQAENTVKKYNAAQKYVSAFPKGKHADEVNTRLSEYKVEAEKIKEKFVAMRKAFQLFSFVPSSYARYEQINGDGILSFTGPDEEGQGTISGSKTEQTVLRHYFYYVGYKFDVRTDYNGTYWLDDDGLMHATMSETNTIGNYILWGNDGFFKDAKILQEVKDGINRKYRDIIEHNMLIYYRDEGGEPYFNVKEKGKEDYLLIAVMK